MSFQNIEFSQSEALLIFIGIASAWAVKYVCEGVRGTGRFTAFGTSDPVQLN